MGNLHSSGSLEVHFKTSTAHASVLEPACHALDELRPCSGADSMLTSPSSRLVFASVTAHSPSLLFSRASPAGTPSARGPQGTSPTLAATPGALDVGGTRGAEADAAPPSTAPTTSAGQQSRDVLDGKQYLDKGSMRLWCAACGRKIKRTGLGIAECAGCHRWFHCTCFAQMKSSRAEGRQVPDPFDKNPWHHCKACQQVHEALERTASSGWQPCARDPERHRFRLVSCRQGLNPSEQKAFKDAHHILSTEFAYTLRDYRSFDYAMVLRSDGESARPVAAAVLDVFGAPFAELFVVASRFDLRGKGHGRALLDQLSDTFAGAGVQRLLVCIDDDDAEGQELWRHSHKFERVPDTEVAQLTQGLPNFGKEEREGARLMCRTLGPARNRTPPPKGS